MDQKEFEQALCQRLGTTPDKVTPQVLHNAIGDVVMDAIAPDWRESRRAHLSGRRACYFSMEFLVGRAVQNNLLCLDLYDAAEAALQHYGVSLAAMEEIPYAALGNGGLGRLAACFLDSAATLNLPLDGYGIRYRYGLFAQHFEDGFQKETADDWTRWGDPWSVRRDEDAVEIHYAGQTVRAVPYDMPVIGYGTKHISTLRLWQAEPVQAFDFRLFNDQHYLEASAGAIAAEDISRVLYPNDDTRQGKLLRLKQEYFFSAASLADILRKYRAAHDSDDDLAQAVAIQLNDTHPVIAIPELIRLLTVEGMPFDKALAIAKQVFHYTNHTIMSEALEKWDCSLVEELLPEVYAIILQINEALLAELYAKPDWTAAQIAPMAIIREGCVHMAHMAVYVSAHTNGVAEIHTEILKQNTLKDWYRLYPERFQNKTNGITQRRWLALCNRELSGLITELLGSDRWMTRLDALEELAPYAQDLQVLQRFTAIKQEKKRQLAAYVLAQEGVVIDPDTVFDIQIKRLHEYKRQLLNAFSILWIYFGIKDGSIQHFTPTTFLFGAKSAPGYRRAKAIIKYINEIAKLVEGDPQVRDLIRVVFVHNYNVSYAEKLVAAADISEQISTAGTEASGTGNMKLMLNGAVTLGTLDGANIEIVEEAGEENNYIFGAKVEELEKIMPEYSSRRLFADNEKIRRVVSTLIDGTVSDGGTGDFRELYYSLLDGASWHRPDHYYLLGDLESYVEAKLRAISDYGSRAEFARKQWLNLCHAGKFSSDRTIRDYAAEIWNITPVD